MFRRKKADLVSTDDLNVKRALKRGPAMSGLQLQQTIQSYVNSAGAALLLWQKEQAGVLPDLLVENLEVALVLAREFRSRLEASTLLELPKVDPHVQELHRRYIEQQRQRRETNAAL